MKIIPSNMERFLSFSVGRMQFIDSFQFASEGLGKLAENMLDEDLVYTQKAFPDPEQFQMMRKKAAEAELMMNPMGATRCNTFHPFSYFQNALILK